MGSSVARVQKRSKEIALPIMGYIEDRGRFLTPPTCLHFLPSHWHSDKGAGSSFVFRYPLIRHADTVAARFRCQFLPSVCFFCFFSSYNNNSSNVLTYCLEAFKSEQQNYKDCFVLSWYKAPLKKNSPSQQYTNTVCDQQLRGVEEEASNRKLQVVTLPLFHSHQAAGVLTSSPQVWIFR